jgi:hypothetical protein
MESFRLYIVVDVSSLSLSLSLSFSRAFAPLNRTSATVCGLLPNMAVWRTREKQPNKRSAGGAVDDVYLKGKERTSRRMRLLSLYHLGFFFFFFCESDQLNFLGRIKDEFRFFEKKKCELATLLMTAMHILVILFEKVLDWIYLDGINDSHLSMAGSSC